MGRAIGVVLFIGMMATCAFGGGIKDGSLSGYSNGSGIVVRWVSDNEQGVSMFSVERSAGGTRDFIPLAELSVRGSGSNYEFVDNSVFRVTDTYYVYRIKALDGSQSAIGSWDVTVRHTTNSVRRTWGSIKAMFR